MGDRKKGGSLQGRTDAFVREFFEKGESLVRELITENEDLRAQLRQVGAEPEPGAGSDLVESLMARVSSLEQECEAIRSLAGSVQAESGGYQSRLDALESEHYNLALRYVASQQFLATTAIDEVLRTITEILLNFVGIGAFTLYAVDETRGVLFAVSREGGALTDAQEIPVTSQSIEGISGLGRPWLASDPRVAAEGEVMRLPLCSGSRMVGLALLEAFLPQKSVLTESDASLLELISERGGAGLETAWIRANAKPAPLQREAIEKSVS